MSCISYGGVTKMKLKTDYLVPVGGNFTNSLSFFLITLLIPIHGGVTYAARFNEMVTRFEKYNYIQEVYLRDLTESCFIMGILSLLFFLGIALANYMISYRMGDSKPIYTYKRISNPWEMHIRCLFIPAAGILLTVVQIIILSIIYYLVYAKCLPAELFPHTLHGQYINGLIWGFR